MPCPVAVVQSQLATEMAQTCGIVLRQRSCRRCHSVFWICVHCDRGQQYCSSFCRVLARQEQRRRANRRYQGDPEVRADNRVRQREYRSRRRRIEPCVTDQSSPSVTLPSNIPSWDARSAETAVGRASVAAFAPSRVSPVWRKESEEQRPPFRCCIRCTRRGHFVDPFPKILRF